MAIRHKDVIPHIFVLSHVQRPGYRHRDRPEDDIRYFSETRSGVEEADYFDRRDRVISATHFPKIQVMSPASTYVCPPLEMRGWRGQCRWPNRDASAMEHDQVCLPRERSLPIFSGHDGVENGLFEVYHFFPLTFTPILRGQSTDAYTQKRYTCVLRKVGR